MPIRSWDDQQLGLLRRNYPHWDLWIVPCYIGPTVWCARPAGSAVATINTDSPEHLIEEIRRQEHETP